MPEQAGVAAFFFDSRKREKCMVGGRIGIPVLWMMLVPMAHGFEWHAGATALAAGAGNAQKPTAASGNAKFAMPFEVESGFLIVVKGQIGSSRTLRFALDTGTTHSMVDTKVAESLGLTLREGFVLNFDRDVRIAWTTVPELSVGGLGLKEARIMVGNLHELTEFTEGIDGVIGLDVLRMAQGIAIDFEAKRVSFRVNGAQPRAASQDVQQEAVLVRLNVHGRPLRLVLDTGARDVFLFEDRVHKHAPALKWINRRKDGGTGPQIATIEARSEFRMGDTQIQSVYLMPKAPDSLPKDIDGYVGLSVLNASYVEMDFAANVLNYVEKSSHGIVRASADENGGRGVAETLAARMAVTAVR